MGCASQVPGARIAKMWSVRSHTFSSRSCTVSAMRIPPVSEYSDSGKWPPSPYGVQRALTAANARRRSVRQWRSTLTQSSRGTSLAGGLCHALSNRRVYGRAGAATEARGGRAPRADGTPQVPAFQVLLRLGRVAALRAYHRAAGV